jgi:L-threonylcarbamoyladenylate synthase
MTELLQVDHIHPDPQALQPAADCLRRGGLVAFPTETVYGLGVHALDRNAVRRLFLAKERPATDPLIVHITSISALAPLVTSIPDAVRTLAARFWPGPLTLVLPRSSAVPDEVTAGLASVAVRVPAHPVARALIAAAGVPVAAPSANLFSRPSPTRASHVMEDLAGRIDMVVDGGPTTIGVESTVLDLTQTPPVILRPGAVTLEMLLDVLPDVRLHAARPGTRQEAMPAPGMLERHYSPRAPMTLYEGPPDQTLAAILAAARSALANGERVGLLVADEDLVAAQQLVDAGRVVLQTLGPMDAPDVAASRLYASLREFDRLGADLILARGSGGGGLALAVSDRLRRAAAGRVVQC